MTKIGFSIRLFVLALVLRETERIPPRTVQGVTKEKGLNMLNLEIISILIDLSLAIVAWLTWSGKYNKYLKG